MVIDHRGYSLSGLKSLFLKNRFIDMTIPFRCAPRHQREINAIPLLFRLQNDFTVLSESSII